MITAMVKVLFVRLIVCNQAPKCAILLVATVTRRNTVMGQQQSAQQTSFAQIPFRAVQHSLAGLAMMERTALVRALIALSLIHQKQ
jgi:hypothetical protein